MKKLLLLCGATAVGKTEIALQLAEKLNTEIISADSVQIYKKLDIGSAKPTKNEQSRAKHHLIDFISPFDNYSVAQYKSDYSSVLDSHFQNMIPLTCGGTGLYFSSIIYDYDFANTVGNQKVRDELSQILSEKGKEYLYGLLAEVDPQSAEKLSINDTHRIIRAIEIFRISGKKKSENDKYALSDIEYVLVGLDMDRDLIYQRINTRVDKMINCGLIEEVESLKKIGLDESYQSMKAIGYKEVLQYLDNRLEKSDMIEKIKQASRNYAKRQITYLKKLPKIIWIENDCSTVDKIQQLYFNT